MTRGKKLNIGIVGCGYITRSRHLPILRQMDEAEVVAVCDIDRRAADALAKAFRIPTVYADPTALFEDDAVEVVDICVPPHLHAPLARAAAAHKRHVIVEKPLAVTSEQAEAIVHACRANKVKLCPIEDHLFFPVVTHLQRLLAKGSLGSIISLTTVLRRKPLESGWRRDPAMSGGPLLENGIHHMMLHVLLLKQIHAVYATAHDRLAIDRSIQYQVTLRGAEAIGTMEAHWGSGVREEYLALFGSKRSGRIEFHRNLLLLDDGGNFVWRDAKQLLQRLRYVFRYGVDACVGKHRYLLRHGHYHQLRDFLEAVNRDTEPRLSGEVAAQGIRLVEAAYRSISTGQEVAGLV